jgi:Fic family protein
VDEVRRILVGDRPPTTAPGDADLVLGYRDAMNFVLRRADDPGFRWDRELLVGLHDRILAGRYDLGAGRLRTGPAWVVNHQTGRVVFEPPDADDVAAHIDRMCRQMEAWAEHPAIAAAWVHVATAAIHPFKDGNGRTARVLASLAMYRGGFQLPEFTSLEGWWGRHLPDYYEAFGGLGPTFDPGRDVTPFVRAHLTAQLHQVRALDLRSEVERRIWAVLDQVARDRRLHERTTNALWDAFSGREVTSRYYRPLADISVATATTDLAACVAAGLLKLLGAGRGRRYVAGPQLMPLVGQTLGIDVPDEAEVARAVIATELSERVLRESRRAELRGERD